MTVVDDDDEDPFVNVVINIQTAKEPLGEKPIQGPSPDTPPNIPRKPKKQAADTLVNGQADGVPGESSASRKRRADDTDDTQPAKKTKTSGSLPGASDDVIVVDDGGAIMIDDD